jgi:hypothetical protein
MLPGQRDQKAASGRPERAWSPLDIGQVVEVDLVGLRWDGARGLGRETLLGTIAAIGPGFISVRAAHGQGAVELTVSSERLRR